MNDPKNYKITLESDRIIMIAHKIADRIIQDKYSPQFINEIESLLKYIQNSDMEGAADQMKKENKDLFTYIMQCIVMNANSIDVKEEYHGDYH